jgi:L-ribulose-5-phosphate 4-epimerase
MEKSGINQAVDLDEAALRNLAKELLTVAERAWHSGVQRGTSGNISIRVPQSDLFLIKRTGTGFLDCKPENLILVNLDQRVVRGLGKPSDDTPVHAGIYRARPDINGIVHTHAPWATTWAAVGQTVPLVTQAGQMKLGGRLPLIPSPKGDGTQNPEDVIEAFSDGRTRAALLEGHGVMGIGVTLSGAEDMVEIVEEAAQTAWLVATLRRG